MDELDVIAAVLGAQRVARADVSLGAGDDAAVLELGEGDALVSAVDTLVAGTHFPEDIPPRAIGHRALAVNLSDIAAMGAEPLWATLSLSLPRADKAWITAFAEGFAALAERHGVALVGGDTVRGPLVVTVCLHGRAPGGGVVTRSGARPGDAIYVTGSIGGAAAGCARWLTGGATETEHPLVQTFLYPSPRVAEGMALQGVASAMIDVSDGLHVDLSRLCAQSDVGARLDAGCVPLPPALQEVRDQASALSDALTGGDDYELVFTAPPRRAAAIRDRSRNWRCGVTRIGEIVATRGVNWQHGSAAFEIRGHGFAHF